ncbi:MarR family transcriptional regulator [soil metagenome]
MTEPTPQVGYLLKKAQAVLHTRMEDALRPLGLSVSQYVCLHLLQQQPGISASELARSAFVTRQSMSTLLQTLLERELVNRADRALTGRALPAALTTAGSQVLRRAEVLVDQVEHQMLASLGAEDRRDLGRALIACIDALSVPPRPLPLPTSPVA